MGSDEEAQGPLNRHPQSLANPDSRYDDIAVVGWRDRVKRLMPCMHWKSCRNCLFGVVLLFLMAGFLDSLFIKNERNRLKEYENPWDDDQRQGNDLSMSHHSLGDGPALHWADGSPIHSGLCCNYDPAAFSSNKFEMAFGSGNRFTFYQEMKREQSHLPYYHNVYVSGDVILRRTNDEHPEPSLDVEMVTDNRDRWSEIEISWNQDTQHLHISVPSKIPFEDETRPCVNIRVTAWVPPDAELDGVRVVTTQLDIRLLDDLSLTILDPDANAAHNEGSLSLVTVVGRIISASTGSSAGDHRLIHSSPKPPASYRLNSRTVSATTVSADIEGHWPLYDYLGLETVSGSIAAAVQPKQNVDPERPLPATLRASSKSGDIELQEPVKEAMHVLDSTVEEVLRGQGLVQPADLRAPEELVPPRDYRLDVQSISGNICGNLSFSTSARLASLSGDTMVNLLPVLDAALASGSGSDARGCDNKRVFLAASSLSGDSKVVVMEPLWYEAKNGAAAYVVDLVAPVDTTRIQRASQQQRQQQQRRPLRIMHSKHETTSGYMKLWYPASWEGDLNMSAMTGDLRAKGWGLEIFKSGSGWPKQLKGEKGKEGKGGRVEAYSVSGDVSFVVG